MSFVFISCAFFSNNSLFAQDGKITSDNEEQAISKETSKQNSQRSQLLSIAVIVEPKQADGSDWDFGDGVDLVLCGVKGCYVSGGISKDAQFYEGATGPRLISKAGSCRDVLKCVFRSVDLSKLISSDDARLSLLDVDYVSDTSLTSFELPFRHEQEDHFCRAEAGQILCEQGVHQRSFSLWAMSDQLAKDVGPSGLDFVLYKGLQTQRVETLTKRLSLVRTKVAQSVSDFFRLVVEKDVPEVCLRQPAFLADSFYVTGLADAQERRAEILLKDLLGRRTLSELKALVQQAPELYWAFLDIVEQLRIFSSAKQAVYVKEMPDLRYLSEEGSPPKLEFGWQVKNRAAVLLEGCLQTQGISASR